MAQIPAVTGSELIKALKKLGFAVIRIRGSHRRLAHPDGRNTTVPVHGSEQLGPGLLLKILRDVEISKDDLHDLL